MFEAIADIFLFCLPSNECCTNRIYIFLHVRVSSTAAVWCMRNDMWNNCNCKKIIINLNETVTSIRSLFTHRLCEIFYVSDPLFSLIIYLHAVLLKDFCLYLNLIFRQGKNNYTLNHVQIFTV